MPADRREAHESGILETFGLTSDAEWLWFALLADPRVDVMSAARAHGLSAGATHAAVNELRAASLVRGSSNHELTAYEPSLAVETLIARTERELAGRHEQLRSIRSKLPALSESYALARAVDHNTAAIEVVVSLEEIRERISLASEQTKQEHRHLMRDAKAASIRAAAPVDAESLARGVHQRSIIGTSDLAEPDVYEALRELHELGEEIRSLPYVPTQMMVMDRDLAVVPRAPVDSSLGAIFVRERTIVDLLVYMFDHLWSIALPVFGSVEGLGAPSGRVARVLELMAAGVKDERIARTLEVGSRTVRRDIAELKERLSVASRTEVVAAAVRQGWL
ncbi:MAG TPA: LuxR C-terminal-related transcriptional regulator [Mycobacteriales bacterium]|nr:LuxR C-terminal-related transcriptional regulator [Mycobacteriales bacterium]